MNKKIIGVIGAGYVGLTTAVCLAGKGYLIYLHENNSLKFKLLEQGKTPFFEPNLNEKYLSVLNKTLFLKKKLEDLINCELIKIIFSCLPTPSSENGSCDLSFIIDLFQEITKRSNILDLILINKSTIIPKTSKTLQDILSKSIGKIHLIHSPEFLRQGSAIADCEAPSRIIFGTASNCPEQIKCELTNLSINFTKNEKIIFTDYETAELIKYASNAYLACRITFINQMFRLAQNLKINMEDLKKGIGLDPRIGAHYLQEGLGFGGSCLPKDLKALTFFGKENNVDVGFLNEILSFNESQLDWYFKEWSESAGDLKNTKIILPAVSFKSATSDMRNSLNFAFAKKISSLSPASLEVCQKHLTGELWKKKKKKLSFFRKKRKYNNIIFLQH